MTFLWALGGLAVLLAVPFVAEALRKPMKDAARAKAPGRFARLSQGTTHFQWTGPTDGPVVVCIHGLTTPSFVWQSISPDLAASGYRVLTYDLFGRGYSDRPDGRQTPAFFLRQLDDLLEDQGVKGEIALIGYSMGGAIATAFATASRHRVTRVLLLAPAGLEPVGAARQRSLIALPLIGRWLMLTLYPMQLRRGFRAEETLPSSVPGITRLQAAELGYRGFLPAVHKSFKGMLSRPLARDHRRLRESGIAVCAIWGRDDRVIPLSAQAQLEVWNPEARHVVIDGAGHGLPYTHTDQVLATARAFLHSDS